MAKQYDDEAKGDTWTDKLKDTAGRVKEGVADTAQIAKKHGEEMHMDVKCAADDHRHDVKGKADGTKKHAMTDAQNKIEEKK